MPLNHPVTVISRWTVGSAQRRQAAADAEIERIRRVGLPRGCRELTVYTSLNGESILIRMDLVDTGSFNAYMQNRDEAADAEVDRVVPGIERLDVNGYHGFKRVHTGNAPTVCTSIVETTFDDADEALRWAVQIDGGGKWPGSKDTYFFVSPDHMRALTITEWTDADSAPSKPPVDLPRSRSGGGIRARCEVYRTHATLAPAPVKR